jgi:prepilin-type N-terminal cleavage/methylation domain-containing protein
MRERLLFIRKEINMNSKGFTTIELIAVMVILSVWTAIGFQKFAVATDFAHTSAGQSLLSELNVRERIVWASVLLARQYEDDESVWNQRNDYLDMPDYMVWKSLGKEHSVIVVQGSTIELKRTPSTRVSSASWLIL